MPYANNKGADQSVHSRSLISAFVIRYLDSIIAILAKSKTTWTTSLSLLAHGRAYSRPL